MTDTEPEAEQPRPAATGDATDTADTGDSGEATAATDTTDTGDTGSATDTATDTTDTGDTDTTDTGDTDKATDAADAAADQAAAAEQADAVRRKLHVSGRVQGVFYRETLRRLAIEKGVGGWAKNVRDGLDAVLEGPQTVVDELILWCREGPPHAVVIHVAVDEEDPIGETEFRVR